MELQKCLYNLLVNNTGRKTNPCSKPNTTMPNTILKNTLNIPLFAKPVTHIPTNVLIPEVNVDTMECYVPAAALYITTLQFLRNHHEQIIVVQFKLKSFFW